MSENENLVLSNINKTWIFDLDGTICVHNGYKLFGEDKLLKGAKEFLDKIDKNDMIIFITARKNQYKEQTEEFLRNNNIRYNYIIFEAPYGERIVINDKKPSGLKTAHSINISRDKFPNIRINIDEEL